MKNKIAIFLLGLTAIIVIAQVIMGQYKNIFIPILWLFLILIPVLSSDRKPFNHLKILYFLIALLTILAQPMLLQKQGLNTIDCLKLSFFWMIPLQIPFWINIFKQYKKRGILSDRTEQSDLIDQIKELISNNEIEQALESASTIANLSSNQETELLNMTFRYEEAKRKNRLGVISNEDLSVEKNRIVTALIELISIIQEQDN